MSDDLDRRVWGGRRAVRLADGTTAFQRGDPAGDATAGGGARAGAAAPAESECQPGPGDDLPEVPWERAGTSLCLSGGGGGGSGALAYRGTDPGAAGWDGGAGGQVGEAASGIGGVPGGRGAPADGGHRGV